MLSYESDSSAGGDSFTETNVLLGYASKDASAQDDTTSHLGGRPEWLGSTPPSATLARCKICHDMMVLLLQLNGDLPEVFPVHERRIYVLACRRKTCRRKEGSIRAVRGTRLMVGTKDTRKEKENRNKESIKAEKDVVTWTGMGESLFGAKPTSTAGSGGANPFSHSFSSSSTTSNSANPSSTASKASIKPFSASTSPPSTSNTSKKNILPSTLPQTFAFALSLNNPTNSNTIGPAPPPEPWPPQSKQPNPYPLYYIADADYETLDKAPAPSIPLPHAMDIDEYDEAGGSSSQKEDKDIYESSMDNTFQKFADRIAQNPEQVIRYEFRGLPLLYSKTDVVGKLLHVQEGGKVTGLGRMPRCGNCGASRVFEIQVMPHAITELEVEEMSLDAGMEWGTVVVGVCEADCVPHSTRTGEVGYLEEWAGVQWEEVGERR